MSVNNLNHAKSLIQQKRYTEARTLLRTINHPTAAKWLAKLEEIDPPTQPVRSAAIPPQDREIRLSPVVIISVLVITFLGGIIVYQQSRLDTLARLVGGLTIEVSTVRTQSATLDEGLQNLTPRVQSVETDVETLAIAVDSIDSDISELGRVVNSHASDINSLSSDIRSLSWDLNSVAAVADNANRWAHSHSYSDATLKTDILAIDNPLERLLAVRGISFTWNDAAYPDLHLESGRDFGVLAQELAVVFPELVHTDPESGLLQVDYEGLIPVLIEAIREQQARIDALEDRVVGETP